MDFTYIDHEKVIETMQKLEKHIGITFNDITWLVKAMNATSLPKRQNAGKNKRRDYTNSALATVGDAVLKTILSDHIFSTVETILEKKILQNKERISKITIFYLQLWCLLI